MSPRSPLPSRILIPVANPGTAEELIRLGAAMLDPRAGELSALGIVEVPEGMPLSEGATRARHARRLLQKVLDYAPAGTAIHPIVRIGRHAAEGITEAAAEQESDLIIFGWGGKAPAGHDGRNGGPTVFSPTIDEVVRESPCDIAVVKQRGTREIKRVLVPVRGGPHAELAIRFADAIATYHGATVVVLHLVPAGITMAVRAQAERALTTFIKQHLKGKGEAVLREAPNVRNAILREAEKADLVVMGASAAPGRRRRGFVPVRGTPRGHRRAREADRRGRQDPRGHRPHDVRYARREGGVAGRRGPGSRGGPRRPGPRRALVR